jgi:malate/lactate dehydrogenase
LFGIKQGKGGRDGPPHILHPTEIFKQNLSLPSVVTRDGVARVVSIPLNASERQALESSAEVLRQYIETLDLAKRLSGTDEE